MSDNEQNLINKINEQQLIIEWQKKAIESREQRIKSLEAKLTNTEQLKCGGCGNTSFDHVFLKEGTWMGTKKLPSEFFRSSEYDFGWDYYPKKDTMQHTCKACGKVAYSLPKDTQ